MSGRWVGDRAEERFEVGARDTAAAYGNDGVEVLGTPALVGWMEDTALAAVAARLAEGQHTVGTLVELRHEAPTAVGDVVRIVAEVEAVSGRELVFSIFAWNSRERIASARHARHVVDSERFLRRLSERLRS